MNIVELPRHLVDTCLKTIFVESNKQLSLKNGLTETLLKYFYNAEYGIENTYWTKIVPKNVRLMFIYYFN